MNQNQEYNNGNVTPYKASGNLNTVIANPSANINDTMNVNIQNMATNSGYVNNNQSYDTTYNSNVHSYINSDQINSGNVNNDVNNSNGIYSQTVNNQSNVSVNKTYVTTDNRPKKKTIKLNLGPEFKIALLIVVILLVFVFLLPMISDMFRGY